MITQNEDQSMDRVSIVIPGVAKANRGLKHRMVRTNDGRQWIQGYKEKDGVEFQNTVRAIAAAAMEGRQRIEGPVRMRYRVYIPVPKSLPKYKQREVHAGLILPMQRPDLDNSLKLCLDALNEIVLADDKQVVRFSDDSGRYYGKWSRIEIDVEPLTYCALQAAEFADDHFGAHAIPGDLFEGAA